MYNAYYRCCTICLPAGMHEANARSTISLPAEHCLHTACKRSSFACSGAHFTTCPSLLTWASDVRLTLLLAPFGCKPAVSMRRFWCCDAWLGTCWKSCARAMSCSRPKSCFFTLSKACSRRCNSSVAFCTNAHRQAPFACTSASRMWLPELPLTAYDMPIEMRSIHQLPTS